MSTRRELEHDRGVAYEEMMRYARAMEDYGRRDDTLAYCRAVTRWATAHHRLAAKDRRKIAKLTRRVEGLKALVAQYEDLVAQYDAGVVAQYRDKSDG